MWVRIPPLPYFFFIFLFYFNFLKANKLCNNDVMTQICVLSSNELILTLEKVLLIMHYVLYYMSLYVSLWYR